MNEILQTNQRVDLKDLNPDALVSFLAGMGKEKFRAEQVLRWIYQRGVEDFAEMTDLAKSFREELSQRATISKFTLETVEVSSDGTRKFLFAFTMGKVWKRC